METIIERIDRALQEAADEKTLATSNHFFKEGERARTWGVKMPTVGKIAKSFYPELKALTKAQVLDLCTALWRSGYLEQTIAACDWSYSLRKKYEPADFETFESWVDNYIDNWASCDTLCNHTVGDFLMMYPAFVGRLKVWARSENRWTRRAAAVSLIVPARKGMFLDDIFRIAIIMMQDGDHIVQKGYGWMLKAASEAHRREVFDFVMANKQVMPRTALRYAIEKMPPEMRAGAMEK